MRASMWRAVAWAAMELTEPDIAIELVAAVADAEDAWGHIDRARPAGPASYSAIDVTRPLIDVELAAIAREFRACADKLDRTISTPGTGALPAAWSTVDGRKRAGVMLALIGDLRTEHIRRVVAWATRCTTRDRTEQFGPPADNDGIAEPDRMSDSG